MNDDMRPAGTESQDERVPLAVVFSFVRRHWRSLLTGVVLAAVSFGVLACGVYCLMPVHTDAWTELRFIFKGVHQDQYPNGLPFAAEELLAVPVVEEVYRRNGIEAYLKYDAFSKALSLSQSNQQLDALERRYQGLLADKKLTAVERSRLEDEWYKQSQQLRSDQYMLHFSMTSRRLLPETVMRKVLADLPQVWAEFAIRQKGVLTYDIVAVSPLSEPALAAKPPLDAFLEIYGNVGALRREVVAISQLPGAGTLRPPAVRATVEDVRIGLDALMQSQLPMAYRDIVLDTLRRHPEDGRRRLDAVANTLSVRAHAADSQAANLLKAYQYYMRKGVTESDGSSVPAASSEFGNENSGGGASVIAQVDSGFLDRISGMATQSLDLPYRQRLIDAYVAACNRAGTTHDDLNFFETNLRPDMAESPVTAAAASPGPGDHVVANLVKSLNALVEQTDALWRQLSRNNLENGTSLYQTVRPFQMRRSGMLTARWWGAAFVAWNGAIFLLLAGVLGWRDVHGAASRRAGA